MGLAEAIGYEIKPTNAAQRAMQQVASSKPGATDDEFDVAFTAAAKVYPGYDKYRERISGRRIRVFVLQPDVA